MQKKTKQNLVLGVPTFGEGEGGSTWLGQNPNFFIILEEIFALMGWHHNLTGNICFDGLAVVP